MEFSVSVAAGGLGSIQHRRGRAGQSLDRAIDP
jgi:hypothetical protein